MFPILSLSFTKSFLRKAISMILSALIAVFPVLFPKADKAIEEYIKEYNVNKIASNSTSDINFSSISADDTKISDAEKKLCIDWYNENIIGVKDGKLPVYNLKIGNKTLRDYLSEDGRTNISVSEECGKKVIEIKIPKEKISVRAESVLYTENATAEWTVFVKNEGTRKSKVVSNFYAAQTKLNCGKSDIYYSLGSSNKAQDFLLKKITPDLIGNDFYCTEGKSTTNFLPYFNICGKSFGCVLGIGWTGMWNLNVKNKLNGLSVEIGQKQLEGYLDAGEEIRSPLVSISFYQNKNAVKGFNTFRKYITDCVYPEGTEAITSLETAGTNSILTSSEIIDVLNSFDKSVFEKSDYFWMDAGWYKNGDNVYNGDWYTGVGTWATDEKRYPNGISELSEYGKQKGLGQILWYEPERVMDDTDLYRVGKEHENWLIDTDSDVNCWNLSDDEALEYITNFISTSIKENGVTYYRQDLNWGLDLFFEKADKDYYNDRKGFCENHYITNEYKFIDTLIAENPGLLIDNCAAGGRRLDLEMAKRSIPLWRSDYNCNYHDDILSATQSQTLGLSCWLPLSGTISYFDNKYEAMTSIIPCVLDTFSCVNSEWYNTFTKLRDKMTENYYPLQCGGYDDKNYLAMQYSSFDANEGFAVIYKREQISDSSTVLKLNGLEENETYIVKDYLSNGVLIEANGLQLMKNGVSVNLPENPDASVITFTVK